MGAVQERVDCAFAVAVYVNAPGAAAPPFGTAAVTDEVPVPAALIALTRNQYVMLLVRPETTNGLVAVLLLIVVKPAVLLVEEYSTL